MYARFNMYEWHACMCNHVRACNIERKGVFYVNNTKNLNHCSTTIHLKKFKIFVERFITRLLTQPNNSLLIIDTLVLRLQNNRTKSGMKIYSCRLTMKLNAFSSICNIFNLIIFKSLTINFKSYINFRINFLLLELIINCYLVL